MNIEDMQAGPELDALVAAEVMGWRLSDNEHDDCAAGSGNWLDAHGHYTHPSPSSFTGLRPFAPSSSIAHAWEVVERIAAMQRNGLDAEFVVESMGRHGTMARVHVVDEEGRGATEFAAEVADTAPLAICRAALKAVRP